jgi:hypothetical protein
MSLWDALNDENVVRRYGIRNTHYGIRPIFGADTRNFTYAEFVIKFGRGHRSNKEGSP